MGACFLLILADLTQESAFLGNEALMPPKEVMTSSPPDHFSTLVSRQPHYLVPFLVDFGKEDFCLTTLVQVLPFQIPEVSGVGIDARLAAGLGQRSLLLPLSEFALRPEFGLFVC